MPARNLVCSNIAHAADTGNYAMPDRGRTGDTEDILHGGIIGIARPYAYDDTGGVANGQVVLKVVRGACFRRNIRIQRVLLVAIFRPERENVVGPEFGSASILIREYRGH